MGAFLLWGAPLVAQTDRVPPDDASLPTFDLDVRNLPLDEALSRLVQRTGLDLLYDPEITVGVRSRCRAVGARPSDLLACVVDGSGLELRRLASGTWVLARPVVERDGVLTGIVVDAWTGQPVPWAEITVPGTGTRATSNPSGHFALGGLPPGVVELVATRIGYLRSGEAIEVSDAPGRIRLELRPDAVRMTPVVVRGVEPASLRYERGQTRVRMDDDRQLSTLTEGVSAAATDAVGVRTSPFAADFLVQGSEAGQNPVLLDGFPIFEPLSLGRSRSAFSPLALDEVRVRKAGFGADGGSFLSGALEISHDFADGEAAGVTSSIDPYAANFRAQLALPRLGGGSERTRGSLMVAGRVGIWDLYREPNLDEALRAWNTIDPVLTRQAIGDGRVLTDGLVFDPRDDGSSVGFSDLHAALRLPIGDFDRLEASFYRGDNTVGTEVFATGLRPNDARIEQVLLTREEYDWQNLGGQLSLHGLLGDRATYRVRARASLHSLDHRFELAEGSEFSGQPDVPALERTLRGELDEGAPFTDANRIGEYAIEGRSDWAAGGSHRLGAGLELVRVESRVFMNDPNLRPLVSSVGQWRVGGFIEDRWSLGDRIDLDLGVRLTHISGRSDLWAEPRAAIMAEGESPLGLWTARLSGGIYHQFVNRFELSTLGPTALVPQVTFWLPVDATVTPPRARHGAAEISLAPAAGWEIRSEVWYKALDRLLDLDYGSFVAPPGGAEEEIPQDRFIGTADGRAWGVGVRLARRVGRNSIQAGYEYSISDRTFPSRFDGTRQPVPTNLPHLFFAGLDRQLPGGFALRLEGRGAWGRSWALRRAYYDFLSVHGTEDGPQLGPPGGDVLPALIDVDAGIRWAGRIGTSRIEAQLLVQNVLDRDNVLDRSLRRAGAEEAQQWSAFDRVLPGRTPVLTFRLLPF
jgi:outer membrane receptor protein involved in Fe transport